jgi:hypothetical protein
MPLKVDVDALVARLSSIKPEAGDISYRLEGMCQAICPFASSLTASDRNHLAGAIVGAFASFHQKALENRYGAEVMKALNF